jgi:hypothetical protein
MPPVPSICAGALSRARNHGIAIAATERHHQRLGPPVGHDLAGLPNLIARAACLTFPP